MRDRETHEMDGFRVEFTPGSGWTCACPDFLEDQECEHVRMAAALRTPERRAAEIGSSPKRH